jgi:5'-methylthioinosine phosphorylase
MSELCALIAGSGFERLGLEVLTRSPTKTPYGDPSSPVLTVRIGGARVACIVRHGEGHVFAPHEVNYRANLWALHQRGIRMVIGINTVGAIAPGFQPGELAVPDQLIDYTSGRAATFGGAGAAVVHAEFAEPFSPVLRGRIAAAIADCGYPPHAGTYGVTQGPRLETAAEISRLQRDGCAMVGMTAMPEAVLARELAVDYAVCAVAVNYAAGRAPEAGPIDTQIHKYMAAGLERLATVLGRLFDRSGPWAL